MTDATAPNISSLPVKHQGITAGARPTAIVPTNMEDCWRLAQYVHQSGLAPKDLDSAQAIMVAIMTGLELGVPPMTALQRIAVINGRPTIWGDLALALVKTSGLCAYVKEWIDGEGDARTAYCETQRKGDPAPEVSKFSVADAKRADLWETEAMVTRQGRNGAYTKENDSPWFKYPERMMQMRARGFRLRDTYPDVLAGLYLSEEMQSERRERTVEATVEAPPPPAEVMAALAAPPPPSAVLEALAKTSAPQVVVEARTGRDPTPYAQMSAPQPANDQAEDASFIDLVGEDEDPPHHHQRDPLEIYAEELAATQDEATFDEVAESWRDRIADMPQAERIRFANEYENQSRRFTQ